MNLKKIISFGFILLVLLLATNKEAKADGIYGCVWNPELPPGTQCIINPDLNACQNGDVPGICDAPDQASCEGFIGGCITPTTEGWACDAGGGCVRQQGGPFANEADCKRFCIPTIMYNCVDPTADIKCQRVFTQNGEYSSVNECNDKCVPVVTGVGKVLCSDEQSIYTAIGCVPFSTIWQASAFIITWGLGIGGGWAILLFAYAGFTILTSSGDPAKLQAGKETLISAISGIIMLIFCVFILRVIGVNVLQLF